MKNASNRPISTGTGPSELEQLYGEAIALRATMYRELIRVLWWCALSGCLPPLAKGLAPRDSIYDKVLTLFA